MSPGYEDLCTDVGEIAQVATTFHINTPWGIARLPMQVQYHRWTEQYEEGSGMR
jgi:hypothetical protein